MKVISQKFLLALLTLGTLGLSNAWADRILITDADQTVTLMRALDCYSAADIKIDTSRPEVYDYESLELQRLADSVRAMLNYECPELSEINITGLVRGLDGVVYQGNLSKRNDWLVQALTEEQGAVWDNSEQPSWQTAESTSDLVNEQLSVIEIKLGMTVEEVYAAIMDAFNIAPEFDVTEGLMTMVAGGCPADFDVSQDADVAQAEWKCLKAWFSDKRVAQLERLELVQVVTTDSDEVQQLLVDKYGKPTEYQDTRFNSNPELLWRAENKQTVETLNATLSEVGTYKTITSLTLANLATDKLGSDSYADVGLRL